MEDYPRTLEEVRGPFRRRGSVPPLPVRTPLARGLSLSALRRPPGPSRESRVAALLAVRLSGLGHRGNDLSRHAVAADDLVPRHLVGDQPKERDQCAGAAARAGAGKLSHGLDVAA